MKKFQTQAQKEFQKMKRFVEKRFPGAHTMAKQSGNKLEYTVLDGRGYAIVDPELMLPPAHTVRKAWEQAKYAAWFTNMIRKSNNAFSDEKMYKKMAKESGDY
jgi:hypothetical protein